MPTVPLLEDKCGDKGRGEHGKGEGVQRWANKLPSPHPLEEEKTARSALRKKRKGGKGYDKEGRIL